MGLDSIELIVSFEKFFSIDIPDRMAEKMATIQEAVDGVSLLCNISDTHNKLQLDVFANIKSALSKCYDAIEEITLDDFVNQYLPGNDKQLLIAFEDYLLLNVPKPCNNWNDITFSIFTDIVCAQNYDTLLNAKNIKSKYEIYIAIAGITIDRIGIDPYEIGPDKSFVKDFGID